MLLLIWRLQNNFLGYLLQFSCPIYHTLDLQAIARKQKTTHLLPFSFQGKLFRYTDTTVDLAS